MTQTIKYIPRVLPQREIPREVSVEVTRTKNITCTEKTGEVFHILQMGQSGNITGNIYLHANGTNAVSRGDNATVKYMKDGSMVTCTVSKDQPRGAASFELNNSLTILGGRNKTVQFEYIISAATSTWVYVGLGILRVGVLAAIRYIFFFDQEK
jgi:hypothetical protein